MTVLRQGMHAWRKGELDTVHLEDTALMLCVFLQVS